MKIISILILLSILVVAGCSVQNTTGESVKEITNSDSAVTNGGGLLIVKEGDLDSGDTMTFEINGQEALLVNFGGEYLAYYSTCPVHKFQVTGSKGEFVCPHSTYNFDGTSKSGPALANNAVLETIDIVVEDGNIYAK